MGLQETITCDVQSDQAAQPRVLLTAPRFFGYELEIAAELERRGFRVDFLPDRPFESPLMIAATRFLPGLIKGPANAIKRRMLTAYGATHYDAFLAINGQTLSPEMMSLLRREFPRMRTVLYMWDSFENRGKSPDELRHYDDCFTFDRECARKFGMRHRPLFFAPGFEMPRLDHFEFDVSFVGTMHTDRYAVLKRVQSALPTELRTYWYLFLQAGWVYYAYRATKPAMRGAQRSEFSVTSLSRDQVRGVFQNSAAVVDIEHPRQRGLTIRTFETIGARKKLLTTNQSVLDYDFYKPENICVLDRTQPIIPADFFARPYVELPAALYRKYSIAGWMDEVMGPALSSNIGAR
jgi:hypothetical protein